MSLLNRPSDGTHSVLIVIYKLLMTEGPMPRERIIGLCSPPAPNDGDMIGKTLNTWLDFGLFEELPGKTIKLTKSVPRSEHTLANLPRLARQLVLREENNPDLWENKGAKASDFTRAISWLLAQDVYEVTLAGWSSAEDLLLKQVPANLRGGREHGLIQNDTRWVGLKAWSVWLGFAWRGRHPNEVLTVDPTPAVADALPGIFGRKQTLAASEFMAGLTEAVPVLDDGLYRRNVEKRLRDHSGPDAWKALPDKQISTSLTRALLRLKQDDTLRLELKADAKDRVFLIGRQQRVIDQVSHFYFKP